MKISKSNQYFLVLDVLHNKL